MAGNGPEFFQTPMGHRFYEGTMPKLARAVEALAEATEKRAAAEARLASVLEEIPAGLLRDALIAVDEIRLELKREHLPPTRRARLAGEGDAP